MDNVYKDYFITDRLIMKVLDEDHANEVLNYYNRNKDFLEKWEAKRDEKFYKIDYHKEQLINEFKRINNGIMYKLWIFERENTEEIIGSITFNNIIRGCFHSCHLGYKLDKNKINKGYMTEGLKIAIDFAFKKLKLHRIEANIMPRNKRSLKVVEKLGFYNEGLAKKYLKINGVWEDHIHMVLINEELS